MKKLSFCSIAFVAAFFLGGCAQQKETAPAGNGMVANVCVVSGETLDASSPTADFQGAKVGFCCDKCLAKWNKLDDAAKKAAVAKVTTPAK